MKVSYNWLQEYIEEELPAPEELGRILTVGAYELEGIDELNGDFVFDFDVQPNRAHDSFGHYGVAREIGVLTGLSVKPYPTSETKEDFRTEMKVEINDKRCYRYLSREIKNIEVKESPEEIKHKLEAMGQRSINNVVDLTNIVLFDMGQPTHCFDKDKVSGNTIFVRKSRKGEKLVTLDDQEIEFKKEEIVIADGERSLSIAGIKGGKETGVSGGTINLLLEAANFDSAEVRFARRDINIETDSSKRFERGITPIFAEIAMKRLTDLLLQYAGTDETQVSDIVDVYPRPAGTFKTGISLLEANKRLGTDLSADEVEHIFNRLNFEFKKVNAKENFVELAKSLEGKPYKYGASVLYEAPESFDCSSLIAYCAKESGQSIPRITIDQYVWAKEIDASELEPGDLVFSNQHTVNNDNQDKFKDQPEVQCMICSEHDTSKEFMSGTKIERAIDHNGIYLGDGKVLHCTSVDDKGTVVEELSESPHFKDIISYRRILEKDEERYVISIPHERIDIRTKEDVTEEIARVYGVNNIKTKKVKRETERVIDPIYFYQTKIAEFLVDNGFSEIMTYTLQSEGDVEIANPLASDKNFMRNTLISGLKESLALNIHNAYLLGLDTVKVFEIGRVFSKEGERWMLSIGLEIKDAKKGKSKTALEEALKSLEEYLRVKLGAKVIEDTVVEIDFEKLVEKLPAPKSDAYYYLDLEKKDVVYEPVSPYPFILRDIAVWVPKEVSDTDLLDTIKKKAGELLITSKLFDRYEKDNKVSYAYRLVFQSQEKTLTDEEINPIMEDITSALNGKVGFEVR